MVRRFLQFQRGIGELGPQYLGCPTDCDAPQADMRRGCPKCPYQIRYKGFQANCTTHFKKVGITQKDMKLYPFDYIIDQMTIIMRANGQTSKGYNRRWSIVVARFVDIYRDEISRMKATDSWVHMQEMKAMMDELKGHRGSTHESLPGVE